MAAIPRTYRPESAIASRRLPALRAPKIETVIGMSGYTHGVRLVAIPPANATANARTEPSASSAPSRRSVTAPADPSERRPGRYATPAKVSAAIRIRAAGFMVELSNILKKSAVGAALWSKGAA